MILQLISNKVKPPGHQEALLIFIKKYDIIFIESKGKGLVRLMNYWIVFRLDWENDVDGFFLYTNETDAEEMCLSLSEEELLKMQYLDYMYCPSKFKSIYTHEMTLLDSCWFVTKCNFVN